jgi:hypothetical protein
MQEPDRTLQAGRRYILCEAQDFYGIWDRESPAKPVETFDLTEAGLQDARKRISKLAAQDFWARVGPTALRWALFGGLALWILSGLILWLRYATAGPPAIRPLWSSPGVIIFEPTWVKVAELAETLAFRVWVAALAIIFALRLLDRGRQPV